MKNLLKAYISQVKKADKNGYAKTFRKCTEVFFNSINNGISNSSGQVFHFTDIEYLDGYFLFAFGTNSVIHFHVAECPGWLFGIWWIVPDENDPRNHISGELFAQYEETLDKFKPSRSEFCEEISISKDENGEYTDCSVFAAEEMLEFIHNEPDLAFCRDYCGWDYNREYHTREEATAMFFHYCEQRENTRKYTEICDNMAIDFVRNIIIPHFNEASIKDLGDNISPRFEIMAPLKKNKHLVNKCGTYALFANDDTEGQEILAKFDSLIEECKKLAESHDVYWTSPLYSSISFYN